MAQDEQDKIDPSEAQTKADGEKNTEQVALYRRKKRNGKFITKLSREECERLQRRKSLFMYLSTLFFAVTLFLKVEGRTRLSQNKELFAVFSLYVLGEVALIVLSVFVSVCNRGSQKIGDLKEKNVPRSGLEHHTFWSYEIFNAVHILLACGEVAVSVYKFGVWGAFDILASAASAVCAFISRQILYRANAGNLEFVPGKDSDAP